MNRFLLVDDADVTSFVNTAKLNTGKLEESFVWPDGVKSLLKMIGPAPSKYGNTSNFTELIAGTCVNLSDAYIRGIIGLSISTYDFKLFKQHNPSISIVEPPDAVAVGYSAFTGMSSLIEVRLPLAISIYASAFKSCSSLKSVFLPEAQYLDTHAFGACQALETVDLPKIKVLGQGCFESASFASVPNISNVEAIGSGAFELCSFPASTSLNLPNCLQIQQGAFVGTKNIIGFSAEKLTALAANMFGFCYQLQEVNFPSISYVPTACFKNCTALKTINMPEVTEVSDMGLMGVGIQGSFSFPKLSKLGEAAMAGVNGLTYGEFPMLTTILNDCFSHCFQLKELSLSAVTYIGANCFSSCIRLSVLHIGTSNCSIEATTLGSLPALTAIKVPSSYVAYYQAASYWSSFSSYIVAEDG